MDDFAALRHTAGLLWGDSGRWLYDTWAAHNIRCFGGRLAPVAIDYGLTSHGRALGIFHHTDAPGRLPRITMHRSLLEPKGNAWHMCLLLGERLAADVLLHEMIHQAIQQELGHNGATKSSWTSHMNPAWVDEVNRLSPLLGLPALAAMPRRMRIPGQPTVWAVEPGQLTRRELSTWPHSITAPGYYTGQEDRALRRQTSGPGGVPGGPADD